jgi:hypothetical protein
VSEDEEKQFPGKRRQPTEFPDLKQLNCLQLLGDVSSLFHEIRFYKQKVCACGTLDITE